MMRLIDNHDTFVYILIKIYISILIYSGVTVNAENPLPPKLAAQWERYRELERRKILLKISFIL